MVQRGKTRSKLDGAQAGLGGRVDGGTAAMFKAELGGEDYWRGHRNAGGAFGSIGSDFHIDDENDFDLAAGYHTMGDRSYTGKVEYKFLGEHMRFSMGVDRMLRYDSYVALVGDHIGLTNRE